MWCQESFNLISGLVSQTNPPGHDPGHDDYLLVSCLTLTSDVYVIEGFLILLRDFTALIKNSAGNISRLCTKWLKDLERFRVRGAFTSCYYGNGGKKQSKESRLNKLHTFILSTINCSRLCWAKPFVFFRDVERCEQDFFFFFPPFLNKQKSHFDRSQRNSYRSYFCHPLQLNKILTQV